MNNNNQNQNTLQTNSNNTKQLFTKLYDFSEKANQIKHLEIQNAVDLKNAKNELNIWKKQRLEIIKPLKIEKEELYKPYKEIQEKIKQIEAGFGLLEEAYREVITKYEQKIIAQQQLIQQQTSINVSQNIQNTKTQSGKRYSFNPILLKQIELIKNPIWLLFIPIIGWIIWFKNNSTNNKIKVLNDKALKLDDLKFKSGIYKITNTINKKAYVGLAENLYNRISQHISKSDSKEAKALYYAFDEFGMDRFDFEIIEFCEKESLREKEKYWINELDTYHTGYNAI